MWVNGKGAGPAKFDRDANCAPEASGTSDDGRGNGAGPRNSTGMQSARRMAALQGKLRIKSGKVGSLGGCWRAQRSIASVAVFQAEYDCHDGQDDWAKDAGLRPDRSAGEPERATKRCVEKTLGG
jgi:hypothetical protein